MLCEQCKQNAATIHFTQVINGERTEMNLCGECAKEKGGSSFAEVSSLLSGLLEGAVGRAQSANALRCSRCGMTFNRFKETGMLGCANCYQDFRKQLAPVLQRIHGRLQHEGHIPASAGQGLRMRRQIEAKRRELQAAIDQEEFERAAALRDELRELQAQPDARQDADGKEGDGAAAEGAAPLPRKEGE